MHFFELIIWAIFKGYSKIVEGGGLIYSGKGQTVAVPH